MGRRGQTITDVNFGGVKNNEHWISWPHLRFVARKKAVAFNSFQCHLLCSVTYLAAPPRSDRSPRATVRTARTRRSGIQGAALRLQTPETTQHATHLSRDTLTHR